MGVGVSAKDGLKKVDIDDADRYHETYLVIKKVQHAPNRKNIRYWPKPSRSLAAGVSV
jgi:hypothetical protein